MSDQKPLSTDPREGLAPVTPTAEGPKMSAAKPQRAIGQTEIAFPDKANPEVTREDNSLFGMPPEVAVLSGMAVGRAMGVVGLTAAGRAIAGLKAAAGQAAPVLKYEVVKHALQAVGISPALATAGAMAISSYKKGVGPAAEVAAKDSGVATEAAVVPAGAPGEAPVAATVQPPAAMPMASPAPASPAAAASEPVAATPAPTAPPMKMSDRLNLFMRTARQAGVTLSPDDYLALNKAVTAGADPQAVIGALVAERNPAAAFASKYNLPQPTGNDLRFPKGMRGKATGAQQ